MISCCLYFCFNKNNNEKSLSPLSSRHNAKRDENLKNLPCYFFLFYIKFIFILPSFLSSHPHKNILYWKTGKTPATKKCVQPLFESQIVFLSTFFKHPTDQFLLVMNIIFFIRTLTSFHLLTHTFPQKRSLKEDQYPKHQI